MICNELDAENAEQTERNLDEVFFERGKHICMRQMQKLRKELHLEMVGDKVTYVRVY